MMVGSPSSNVERPPESGRDATVPAASAGLLILSRPETKWLTLGSLAFALVFFFPIFYEGGDPGAPIGTWMRTWPQLKFGGSVPSDLDRDVFMELRWVPYYTLSHFHQFPYMDPAPEQRGLERDDMIPVASVYPASVNGAL